MKFSILPIVGFLSLVSSAPTSSYSVHERRSLESKIWIPRDIKLDRRYTIPLSISLTQQNLDKGYEFLMDVSDGKSKNYGKHWSVEQIAETFAPTEEAVAAVKAWLASHGIEDERLSVSKSKSWIRFNSTIGEAEELMKTEYKLYEHPTTEKIHIACDEYSVPSDIKQHIDYITPTIGLNAYIRAPKKTRSLRLNQKASNATAGLNTKPKAHAVPGDLYPLPQGPVAQASSLSNCNSAITPDCLRALYGFPVGSLNKSSFGIVEFTPQAYLQSDLNLFYSTLAKNVPSGTAPTLNSIDGGVVQTKNKGFNYNGESDLDLEYAISLVYPQKVTLYQAGDLVEGASFNDFLDAIDGSFCSYAGGDSIGYDSVYPDPYAGGYKGAKACGTFKPASVISISYNYNEADLPGPYMNRQCNEYMKLGLQGVTIVVSSGDYGVAGNTNQCCTNPGCAGGGFNGVGAAGSFTPSFPSTCPYITSVGATQIVPGASVTSPEQACATVIYSGGGFSNNFALPSYQSGVVGTYFKSYKPSYSSKLYNSTGKSRGIPDVSANGANYLVALEGSGQLVYGTSASAPTFGSIITLINEQRINAGKKPVGFVNPVLYANPSALNDITKGTNPGCKTNGFSAVKGWDPVTGLGTPNYTKLLAIWKALP